MIENHLEKEEPEPPDSAVALAEGSEPLAERSIDSYDRASSIGMSRSFDLFIKKVAKDLNLFPIGEKTRSFKEKFYPSVNDSEWSSWRWQIKNRITGLENLEKIIPLQDTEVEAILMHKGSMPLAITPYYASLLDPDDFNQPVRKSVIPTIHEHLKSPGESEDPLHEDEDCPVPGLVHRYPDRVLFLVTNFCTTNCRYCTRSRMIKPNSKYPFNVLQWEMAINYIENTPAIRDVLISGGDPLSLPTAKLEWLLQRLRRIPHVEFIRIGTKIPVVMPQRISNDLVRMLKRYHPLWMSIHFTHPDELTPETAEATRRLADAGIPLGSQTVLLKGVNDNVETMKSLMHGLLKNRVRPYYIYQCDPIAGSAHFRTPVEKGIEIIEGLRGHTSGYAVPSYVIDAPGGGGKIPILPDYLQGRDGGDVVLRNYKGLIYRYPDHI